MSSLACRPGPIPRIITDRLHGDLRAIVSAALRACDPAALVSRALATHPVPPAVRLSVVAAGKAAVRMADAFVAVHGIGVADVLVARGSHPLPDAASVEAAERALARAREGRARGELLVVLLSGGASAMFEAPAEGLTLADVVALNRYLLASGLPIAAMNAVRKHVSAIKGGRLAAAAGRSITYAISDVHGPIEDDPAVIGSGPTVADPSTFADALRALGPEGGQPPSSLRGFGESGTGVRPGSDRGQTGVRPGSDQGQTRVRRVSDPGLTPVVQYLQRGARGEIAETPKPGDPDLAGAQFVLAGSRRNAMDGAAV